MFRKVYNFSVATSLKLLVTQYIASCQHAHTHKRCLRASETNDNFDAAIAFYDWISKWTFKRIAVITKFENKQIQKNC